ncbi:ABC transporter substrate-binding protein [Nonomuraea sp. NEAU-A123]|nr:ABC transporter substrate-binding protein [Nonomuraea sp. NEAU-A123]
MDGDDAVDAAVETGGPAKPPLFRPVVDGRVIPAGYEETYAKGLQNAVRYIAGSNLDESGAVPESMFTAYRAARTKTWRPGMPPVHVTLDDYVAAARRRFGALAGEFLRLYPAGTDDEAARAHCASVRDNARVSTFLWAADWTRQVRRPVYTYFWTHASPARGQNPRRASHGSEIEFVFGNLDGDPDGGGAEWTGDDRRGSRPAQVLEALLRYGGSMVTGDDMGHHVTDGGVVGSRTSVTRGRLRAVALATVLALGAALTAACGDSGSAQGGGLTAVMVGSGESIFDLPLRVAQAKGYFQKQGLKVTFVSTNASTGPAALESGSVQFLNSSPTGFLSALAKGLPQVAIAADGLGNPLGIVVSKKFADANKLSGSTPVEQVAKALGTSIGGASSANTKAQASTFLKTRGVDPAKVKWVSLPSPAANKAALNSGQIDWFITSEPTPLSIEHAGEGVVVADPLRAPEWSPEQSGYGELVVVRKDYLEKNPEIAKKFVGAVQEATAYMNTHLHDADLLNLTSKEMSGIPVPVIEASLQHAGWPASAAMDDAIWAKTLGFVNGLGVLSKVMTVTANDWTNTYVPTSGGA